MQVTDFVHNHRGLYQTIQSIYNSFSFKINFIDELESN